MFSPTARPDVLALRASQIREVANVGMARKDVLKFWVGESDQPTPAFIREATAKALMDGETIRSGGATHPRLRIMGAIEARLVRAGGGEHVHDVEADGVAIDGLERQTRCRRSQHGASGLLRARHRRC